MKSQVNSEKGEGLTLPTDTNTNKQQSHDDYMVFMQELAIGLKTRKEGVRTCQVYMRTWYITEAAP